MRIAFLNHSRRKIGGVEMYLDSIIPAFPKAGHEIAMLYEEESTARDRDPIALPAKTPTWCAETLGPGRTIASLQQWQPDVCFSHGLRSPDLEAELVAACRSVMYVHNYYGTCISGHKTHNTSPPRPCERKFGAGCLVHYFPDRCGGRSPLTMWQMFRLNSRRLQTMRRYQRLVTNSQHLVRELARYELNAQCIYLPVIPPANLPASTPALDAVSLVFAARLMPFKGGQYLLGALPEIQRRLGRKLRVLFAGEGAERSVWEQIAASIRSENIVIEFAGWLSTAELRATLPTSHLLVFPSVAPEPFGLSGLEAGLYGVPSVAFALGGIPEWLHDGVNGHLASVGTHTLADAIVRSLENPEHYAQLRIGALRRAREHSLASHLAQLLRVFQECAA